MNTTKTEKIVAYYRVSTKKQGAKGLGMNVQEREVKEYAAKNNLDLVASFVEVESGKKGDRLELANAIECAKSNNAKLVIAKLDRLSRNVSFIFTLKESGVRFKALDLPDMNTLTIGIFASMAQHERELISKRTKKALAEKKAQGFQLGNNNLTSEGVLKSAKVRREKALDNPNNKRAYALIRALRTQGNTYQSIADELNREGYRSSKGNKFSSKTVNKLYKMFREVD